MVYCIDTSSLIQSWTDRYPHDLFPTFWEKLSDIIASGDLVASSVVHVELKKKDDELCEWIKTRQQMFIQPDKETLEFVKDIMNNFNKLVKQTSDSTEADAFVIALAIRGNYTVVTQENVGTVDRPKIPHVCRAYKIKCITILEMMRELGWSFP